MALTDMLGDTCRDERRCSVVWEEEGKQQNVKAANVEGLLPCNECMCALQKALLRKRRKRWRRWRTHMSKAKRKAGEGERKREREREERERRRRGEGRGEDRGRVL